MKSLKYVWVLIKHLFKSAVYKVLLPLMLIGFVYSIHALIKGIDMTAGFTFALVVLFGTLLHLSDTDLGKGKKE